MKILSFFLFFWVIFPSWIRIRKLKLMRIHADPDPKPWKKQCFRLRRKRYISRSWNIYLCSKLKTEVSFECLHPGPATQMNADPDLQPCLKPTFRNMFGPVLALYLSDLISCSFSFCLKFLSCFWAGFASGSLPAFEPSFSKVRTICYLVPVITRVRGAVHSAAEGEASHPGAESGTQETQIQKW